MGNAALSPKVVKLPETLNPADAFFTAKEREWEKKGGWYGTPEGSKFESDKSLFRSLALSDYALAELHASYAKAHEETQTSDGLTLWQFREYFDLPDTSLTQRVFKCFDEDKDERVSFVEFVVCLWSYLTDIDYGTTILSFDIFDVGKDGMLSLDEGDRMIVDIFGSTWKQNQEAMKIHSWLHNSNNFDISAQALTVDHFHALCLTHEAVRFLALNLLKAFQAKVLGTLFWEYQGRQKVRVSDRQVVTCRELIHAHVSQEALATLAKDKWNFHNKESQQVLLALRRTGTYTQRRMYSLMRGKQTKITKRSRFNKRFADLSKRANILLLKEVYERVTVEEGEPSRDEEVVVQGPSLHSLQQEKYKTTTAADLQAVRAQVCGGSAAFRGKSGDIEETPEGTKRPASAKAASRVSPVPQVPKALLVTLPPLGDDKFTGSTKDKLAEIELEKQEALARSSSRASRRGPHAKDGLKVKKHKNTGADRPISDMGGKTALSRAGKRMIHNDTEAFGGASRRQLRQAQRGEEGQEGPEGGREEDPR